MHVGLFSALYLNEVIGAVFRNRVPSKRIDSSTLPCFMTNALSGKGGGCRKGRADVCASTIVVPSSLIVRLRVSGALSRKRVSWGGNSRFRFECVGCVLSVGVRFSALAVATSRLLF